MPAKKKVARDPLPESFPTPEAAGDFWDTHDLADYWDLTRQVKDLKFEIKKRRFMVSLEPSLAARLRTAARKRGISSETLIHLWLSERLQENSNNK